MDEFKPEDELKPDPSDRRTPQKKNRRNQDAASQPR